LQEEGAGPALLLPQLQQLQSAQLINKASCKHCSGFSAAPL
jgi:hypothetical protein